MIRGLRRRARFYGGPVAAALVVGFLAAASFYTWNFKPRLEPWQTTNGKILEAFAVLHSTQTGRELVSTVGPMSNVQFEVGRIPDESTIAYHSGDSFGHRIRVGPNLAEPDGSTAELAGVLAHELTHVRQRNVRPGRDYLDDEMEAMVNEALVLRELERRSPSFDVSPGRDLLNAFDGGRRDFEAYVRACYPKLGWLGPRRFAKDYWGGYYARAEARYARIWKREKTIHAS